ncbi:MAG: protein-L-isoaspartate O-methyltransferase [Methyloceanibacter sp.]|jgi:protein-L-isoaspartate(D-aspartate) O-methyltransferase
MVDFDQQRLTMVESQLRPNEVTDRRLLAAMRTLPRERFVPERLSLLAYMDESVEVFPAIDGAPARFLLPPMVLARLVQLAAVEPKDHVLDIGCATGYSTAVLACLGRRVVGLEPEPELAETARRMLRELAIENATIVEGALAAGTPEDGPYDVILLNGSIEEIPASVLGQLREGARLVAILASGANSARPGKAFLFVKIDGEASGLPHFDAGARALPGFSRAPAFAF